MRTVHAARTVMVPASAGDVFAFLADGENEMRWRPSVRSAHLVSGSGAGAVWAQTMRGPLGRTIRGDYRITRQDEPAVIAFEVVAGPVRPTGRFDLVADGPDRTRVTFSLDVVLRGGTRLLSPLVARQVAAEADTILNVPAAMRIR